MTSESARGGSLASPSACLAPERMRMTSARLSTRRNYACTQLELIAAAVSRPAASGPATYVDGEADGLVRRHVAAVHRAAHSSMMSSEFTAQFAPSGSEKQCGRESWPDRVNRAGIERVHQRFRKKLGSAVTSRSAQRRGPPLATRICCCRTRRPRTG